MFRAILTLTAVALTLGVAGPALGLTTLVEVMDENVFMPGGAASNAAGNGASATIDANRGGGSLNDLASSLGRFNLPPFPALTDGSLTVTIFQNAVGPSLTNATLDVRLLSLANHNYDSATASRANFDHSTPTDWSGANNSIFDGTVFLGTHTITAAEDAIIGGGGSFPAVFNVPMAELNEAIANRGGVLSLLFACDQCEGPRGADGEPTSSGQTHGFTAYGKSGAAPATLEYRVPEPASLALLTLGGLLMLRRKA